MIISKQIEWDMGHRVTNHRSKCHHLHGHRYKLEIFMEGELISSEGSSDQGMVIDFGDIKKVAIRKIHDVLDHGFMVWEKDNILIKFFNNNPDLKSIMVPFVPTAENLAAWIFEQLKNEYKDIYSTGLHLHSVKIWETPNSSAIYTTQKKS